MRLSATTWLAPGGPRRNAGFVALAAPVGFVALWSTGFIGAKLGLPYADPMSFLALRFWIVAVLLGLWMRAVGAPAPDRALLPALIAVGVLNHGIYLGGVFTAIGMGLNAGVAALVAGLAPIFTALIAGALGWERITPRRWLGMALGFAGVALAVGRKIDPAAPADWAPAALCLAGAVALAAGTVAQRRFLSGAPMAGGNLVQYAAACVVAGIAVAGAAAAGAAPRVVFSGAFLFALGWLVMVLSLGAVSILYWLLRRGEASSVSSLMFLTPGVAAAIAWALFGETLGPTEITGFAIAMIGVALVTRGTPRA